MWNDTVHGAVGPRVLSSISPCSWSPRPPPQHCSEDAQDHLATVKTPEDPVCESASSACPALVSGVPTCGSLLLTLMTLMVRGLVPPDLLGRQRGHCLCRDPQTLAKERPGPGHQATTLSKSNPSQPGRGSSWGQGQDGCEVSVLIKGSGEGLGHRVLGRCALPSR